MDIRWLIMNKLESRSRMQHFGIKSLLWAKYKAGTNFYMTNLSASLWWTYYGFLYFKSRKSSRVTANFEWTVPNGQKFVACYIWTRKHNPFEVMGPCSKWARSYLWYNRITNLIQLLWCQKSFLSLLKGEVIMDGQMYVCWPHGSARRCSCYHFPR